MFDQGCAQSCSSSRIILSVSAGRRACDRSLCTSRELLTQHRALFIGKLFIVAQPSADAADFVLFHAKAMHDVAAVFANEDHLGTNALYCISEAHCFTKCSLSISCKSLISCSTTSSLMSTTANASSFSSSKPK